jgi:transposase
MIVIGTDTHKATHTCGAVFAETGQLAGERTAPAREPGFRELLAWGRDLDSERIWAIEGCRHVSGSLERFLVASGEQVVPDLELPAGCLDRARWLDRVARKLARAEQSARVRISRELVRAIRNRTRRASELEREIGALVRARAPQLLDLPGCGTLSAAKLIAETAGAARFASDAQLRASPNRGDPGPGSPAGPRLPGPKASRGQVENRSHTLPQAPPCAPGLAAVDQI